MVANANPITTIISGFTKWSALTVGTNTMQMVLPNPTNFAYWNNPTMFDLAYASYPKDLFFGLLPDSQYGDTAVVDVDIDAVIAQENDAE